jgi:hypothetical protein
MSNEPKVLFYEVQRFSPLVVLPFVLLFLVAIALEGHMVIRPILETDEPWPVWALPLSIIGIGIDILITLVLIFTKLETRLEAGNLYIRFFPLHLKFREIDLKQIAFIYARTYQPLSEFGGHGIRFSTSGKAFNISGNRGLQLEFENGHRLLIGTQKPQEFASALQDATFYARVAKSNEQFSDAISETQVQRSIQS